MEVTGIIKVIKDTQLISDAFSKRELVLTEDHLSTYPQVRQYELHKDNCSKLDSFKVGDEVTIEFNRNGKIWTNNEGVDKYFNTDVVWKIAKVGAVAQAPPQYKAQPTQAVDIDDDLPF